MKKIAKLRYYQSLTDLWKVQLALHMRKGKYATPAPFSQTVPTKGIEKRMINTCEVHTI